MKYIIDCISDTHQKHNVLEFPTPVLNSQDVWILAHAGDFSHHGKLQEVTSFVNWLETLPHQHKVVICGNHELLMDKEYYDRDAGWRAEMARHNMSLTPTTLIKGHNVHYLQESGVTVEGLEFWGSPYSPRFFDWGFQTDPWNVNKHWNKIPQTAKVVLAHGPPQYYGDACPDMNNANKTVHVGCPVLLKRLQKVKPLLTVSGHIHEGFGIYNDVTTGCLYVNASVLTGKYEPHHAFVRAIIENNKITTELIYYAKETLV